MQLEVLSTGYRNQCLRTTLQIPCVKDRGVYENKVQNSYRYTS